MEYGIWKIIDQETSDKEFHGEYLGEILVDSYVGTSGDKGCISIFEEALRLGQIPGPGVYAVLEHGDYSPCDCYIALAIVNDDMTWQKFTMPKTATAGPRVTHWPPK